MSAVVSDHRRIEECLHRCPQAACSQAGRGSAGCRASKRRTPPLEARNEHVETHSGKTGNHRSLGREGRRALAHAGRFECARPGQGHERAACPLHHHYRLPVARGEGFRLEYHWDLDGQLLGFPFVLAGNSIESIYDLCEAVDWIEREIHEGFAMDFMGREYEPLLLRQGDKLGVNLREGQAL